MPEEEVKRHMASLLLALVHAHSQGMVHGNISSNHVYLHNGVAFLGLCTNAPYARAREQMLYRAVKRKNLYDKNTRQMAFVAEPYYLAPEADTWKQKGKCV